MNVSQYPTPIILTKLNSDLTFIYSIVLLRSDSVKLKFTHFHSKLYCKILLTTCLVSCFYLYPNVPNRVFVFCLTKCFCFYDLQLLIVSCVIRIFRLCPIQSKPCCHWGELGSWSCCWYWLLGFNLAKVTLIHNMAFQLIK